MKKNIYTILAVTFVVLIGAISSSQRTSSNKAREAVNTQAPATTQPKSQIKDSQEVASKVDLYTVVRVVDGDTVDVKIGDKVERLRLIGIDTPETVDPRKTVQCFGAEASNKAKTILTGKKVSLQADPTQDNRDKYGRLLRYVYLENGTNFNKMMITEGYAHEYTYYVPYQMQSEFKAAQKDAEQNRRGLWSPATCNGVTSSGQKVATPTSGGTNSAAPTPQGSSCNPNYTPCIPNSSTDLNCSDISIKVRVVGTDVYHLDRDGDGFGCDAN